MTSPRRPEAIRSARYAHPPLPSSLAQASPAHRSTMAPGHGAPPRQPASASAEIPGAASSPGRGEGNAWLYHATSRANLDSIRAEGLRPGAYLAEDEALADYYLETIADEGASPVLLRVALANIPVSSLAPDMPGLEEPIMTVVRARSGLRDEEAVWKAWESAHPRHAGRCLELIGSCRCVAPLPPSVVQIRDDAGCWQPLSPMSPPPRAVRRPSLS